MSPGGPTAPGKPGRPGGPNTPVQSRDIVSKGEGKAKGLGACYSAAYITELYDHGSGS